MLFWLTFFQSLPPLDLESTSIEASSPIPTLSTQEPSPTMNADRLQLAQLGGNLTFFGVAVVTVIVLLLSALFAYTRLYKVTPANEAFVKTGGFFRKRRTVIKHGGGLVLPVFDELTRVPLKEISIDVERTGKLAVRTKDYLRADMRVTFFVCINAIDEDIRTATERLSQNGKITATDIKNAIEKRADDAIRAAAKSKNLAEIDSDKLGFAQEVLNLIEPDLKKVGLTLNNIAISEIEEGDTYDTNNFFDAQGVRLRTETIQRSIRQQREVELSTQVAIEQKELEAQRQSLDIARDKESAQLQQQLELESLRAQRAREIQVTQDSEAATTERQRILKQQSVEEEKIQRRQVEEQKQIEANIALEESNKRLKVAQALQKQEAEMAEINRQKTIDASRLLSQVEVAEAEQQSKIAQQQAAIAIARKEQERFNAEADRATAESAVRTATAIEEAQRQQRLSAIAAEQEAEKSRIAENNVVEIEAFRRRRQAEVARQAAELEAESIRTLADANRDSALAEAQGKQAIIEAENALSDANRVANLIRDLWPELALKLPEILQALAPQPGVIGDARIYAFPGSSGSNGSNGNGIGDINKLMLSTSGFALLNSLLEDGKVEAIAGQIKRLLQERDTNDNQGESEVNQDIAPSRVARTVPVAPQDLDDEENAEMNS